MSVALKMLNFYAAIEDALRLNTLLHVSSLKGRPIKCHVGFLLRWKREKEERDKSWFPEATGS